MELRHIKIKDTYYYYLYHGIQKNNKYFKYEKYVGTKKPSEADLKILKADFLKEIEEEKIKKSNIIELLQEAQNNDNHITEEELVQISTENNIPLTDLIGVATFYSEFKLKNQGQNQIKICNGTACHVKHSLKLITYLENLLKIKPGEVTEDDKFSLEIVNCIGACARAPAMMINDEIYGELTEEKVQKIIKNIK